MNKQIERNNHVKEQITHQNMLLHEMDFVRKYGPRFTSKTFWLGGKTKKQLVPIMEEYLTDFKNAHGYMPGWYMHSDLYSSRHDVSRFNIQSFLEVMKDEWRRNQ